MRSNSLAGEADNESVPSLISDEGPDWSDGSDSEDTCRALSLQTLFDVGYLSPVSPTWANMFPNPP